MPPKKQIKPKSMKPKGSSSPGENLLAKIILGKITEKDLLAVSDNYQVIVRFLESNQATLDKFGIWFQEESYEREDEETGESVAQFQIEIYLNNDVRIVRIFEEDGSYDADIEWLRP